MSAWGGYPQRSRPRGGKSSPVPELSTGCSGKRSHHALRPFTFISMGEWTTAELREQGLSKEAIRRKVREGKLYRVHRGIYTDSWTPLAVARTLAHGLSRIHFTGKTAQEIYLGRQLTFPLEAEGPRTLKGKCFRVSHSRLRGHTQGQRPTGGATAMGCTQNFARM